MRKTITDIKRDQTALLCKRIGKDPNTEDDSLEWKIINSFYRFAAFCEHNFEYDNDYTRYTPSGSKKREERIDSWEKRLNNWLDPYALEVEYSGYMPNIAAKGSDGCTVISAESADHR